MQQTIAYTYGDSNWKDKLTAYNGTTISYDAIGNPTSDGTWTYTWTNGRQLASMSKSGTSASYTYNENGLRVQKNVNGTVTSYVLHGKSVVHLTQGSNNLHFFYGADGSPAIVEFNGVSYGYVKNLQGDIIAIVNASGTKVVEYAYDAWGRPLTKTGSMAGTLGALNPFRYRGYVYDEETGLYYLRSRYYNPSWSRFVNADALIDQSQILAPNSFAYCSNQAINRIDPSGHTAVYIDLDDDFDHDGPFSLGVGIGGYFVDFSCAAQSSSWSSPLYDGLWTGYYVHTPATYIFDRRFTGGTGMDSFSSTTAITIPQKAIDMLDYLKLHNFSPMPGYKGGREFSNDGRDGTNILPSRYAPFKEFDIDPKIKGVPRNRVRIIVGFGDNGIAWYTSDHYESFHFMDKGFVK